MTFLKWEIHREDYKNDNKIKKERERETGDTEGVLHPEGSEVSCSALFTYTKTLVTEI